MTKKLWNERDVRHNSFNQQEFQSGTSIVIDEPGTTFFIFIVIGTTVTIKDADGNTMFIIAATTQFEHPPLRVENGFQVTSGSSATVGYFRIR